ncbi:MAG TPA: helix-turn-helix domain-containing protein, partial [Pyrinomonadaceae bacterium]|nr:helix-turn-helix domain-containing protein [Pyrinomonadaceae bacterium]
AAAESVLLAGTLTSYAGWAGQVAGAQALAKKLLAESARLFERAGLRTKAAEALAELAWCLWRAGDQEVARRLLWKAIAAMGDGADGRGAKAVALLRAGIFEEQSGRLANALKLLRDYAPFFESCNSPVLLGKLRNNLGIVLRRLGEEPGHEDFLDQAVIEYAASSLYFEQAGATRLLAHSENNHGFVLILLGKFGEAAERLELARALFAKLGDRGHAAQVDETRARLLLAEERPEEAVRLATGAVRALAAGGPTTVLAEALITLGKALARTGHPTESRDALGRAMQIAKNVGAPETAGEAALTADEELCEWLDPDGAVELYEFAYSHLEGARHARARMLLRLSRVARMVYAPWRTRNTTPEAPRLWASARRLAASNSPALVVGKEAEARWLLAYYAHALSGRPGRVVVIDCDAIEDESPGPDFFEQAARKAAGGILLLERVECLSKRLQPLLLSFMRDNVGRDDPQAPRRERLAARVVAATSCDLSREAALKLFDASLFDALGGRGPHNAPSAQELEELRLLSECFDAGAFGRPERPGTGLPQVDDNDEDWRVDLEGLVKDLEVKWIRKALVAENGHIGKAAWRLGMHRQTLDGKIKKYPELQEWRTPVIK